MTEPWPDPYQELPLIAPIWEALQPFLARE